MKSKTSVSGPVAFAGVNGPDGLRQGILTALEAGELELHGTRLLVLSACDTGLGKTAGGEGVLGLQRAFQVAGVRTTLTTLWNVDDEKTHQLMREFYKRLRDRQKPVRAPEALPQAQLWLHDPNNCRGVERDEPAGRHSPYHRAAFVLAGDWR